MIYEFSDFGNIYLKIVPFAHGSYKSNTIEKVDALHRETVYPCFVIFITTSLQDLTAGFQIFPKVNWHHEDVMAWICFCQTGQVVEQTVDRRVAGDLRRNAINLSSV